MWSTVKSFHVSTALQPGVAHFREIDECHKIRLCNGLNSRAEDLNSNTLPRSSSRSFSRFRLCLELSVSDLTVLR